MIQPEQVLSILTDNEILPDAETLTAESDLFVHGLDSMALMQLLIQIETSLGIALPPSSITRERFSTASALAGFLSDHEQVADHG